MDEMVGRMSNNGRGWAIKGEDGNNGKEWVINGENG